MGGGGTAATSAHAQSEGGWASANRRGVGGGRAQAGAAGGSLCGGAVGSGVEGFTRPVALPRLLVSPVPSSPPAGTGGGQFLALQVRAAPCSWALPSGRGLTRRPRFRSLLDRFRGGRGMAGSGVTPAGAETVVASAVASGPAATGSVPWRGQAARGGAGRVAFCGGPGGGSVALR